MRQWQIEGFSRADGNGDPDQRRTQWIELLWAIQIAHALGPECDVRRSLDPWNDGVQLGDGLYRPIRGGRPHRLSRDRGSCAALGSHIVRLAGIPEGPPYSMTVQL